MIVVCFLSGRANFVVVYVRVRVVRNKPQLMHITLAPSARKTSSRVKVAHDLWSCVQNVTFL